MAEIYGSLPLGRWLIVTCRLTACTLGSASGPTLGNEYGKSLPFYSWFSISVCPDPCIFYGRLIISMSYSTYLAQFYQVCGFINICHRVICISNWYGACCFIMCQNEHSEQYDNLYQFVLCFYSMHSITGAGRDFFKREYIRCHTSSWHQSFTLCRLPTPLPAGDVTWPRPHPVWPLGGARNFSLTQIFSKNARAIRKIFSSPSASQRALPYLSSGDHQGRRSDLGARTPK